MELVKLLLALDPVAAIYESFVQSKGEAWCRHWESVPLHMLLNDNVTFKMLTLGDCQKAVAALDGLNGPLSSPSIS